ncbi:MAG: hypothetical protein QF724_02175 [Planctomycetota bacterium]|jgi:hypothetical protein|nr:hypothetical protein [Planctomycetota bacterium]MDP6519049.1 hypothetical protein [Planctomycetota bacterium]MDP6837720.1 hypothetical protein [Planctomycetota bacterium]MDP6956044.1 hypothetical protein [Planctomycetota bacterium]
MIRINLAPREARGPARAPLVRAAAISVLTVLATCAGLWWGWLRLVTVAGLASEVAALEVERDGLAPRLALHRELTAELRSLVAREAALELIAAERVPWTAKLDQFVDTVADGEVAGRYLVWFDDLNVTGRSSGRGPGSLSAAGQSGSEEWDQVARFLEDLSDLESTPFMEGFAPPAWPEGTQSSVDEELAPAVVWSFPLELEFAPTQDTGGKR